MGHEPVSSLSSWYWLRISNSRQNFTYRMAYTNVIENGGAVHFVYSSRLTGDVVLLNKDQNYVSMKTINGFPIGEIRPDEKIESVCISSLDPGKNVNLIAIGCNYGLIR